MTPSPADPDPPAPTTLAPLPELTRSIELVRAFQAGETGALNELFERYHGRLRRIVGVRMGPRLRRVLDEEDVMQEVFLVASEHLSGFEPRSHASILQWLTRIAEHKIKEHVAYHHRQRRDLRRQRSLGTAEETETRVRAIEPEDSGPSPSELSIRSELEEIVDAFVERLEPQPYREAILQRDYYGADWEDVRVALERPTVEAVQELYRRAHKKLTGMIRERIRQSL